MCVQQDACFAQRNCDIHDLFLNVLFGGGGSMQYLYNASNPYRGLGLRVTSVHQIQILSQLHFLLG